MLVCPIPSINANSLTYCVDRPQLSSKSGVPDSNEGVSVQSVTQYSTPAIPFHSFLEQFEGFEHVD